jgi:hypothetical protein
MVIVMINAEIAEFVLSQIGPGEIIEAYTGPEKKLNRFEFISATEYAVIVVSPGTKPVVPLELSVNKLKLYQDEMMRIAPPPEVEKPAAKPRGRPKGSENKPQPVEQQKNWQTETVLHPEIEGVRVMADTLNDKIKNATAMEFEDDFVTKAITEACDNFKADMIEIVTKVYVDNTPDASDSKPLGAVTLQTCLHCANMFDQVVTSLTPDMQTICKKFNIVPPLFVMVDAKGQCPDFVESDVIPF